MSIDETAFNFDAMKEAVGVDPFAETANKYAKDERFYTLAKDKDGNGAALIRFMIDPEKGMIQKLFKINTTVVKNGKKRFVSEFSPSSIGAPDPFQEEWQRLWNEGDKEGAKQFGRGITYVANIKVIKDPANPENEGKWFMYQMSGAMKDKVQNAVDPSQQDRDLGKIPMELFNPLKGNSFRLVAKKGANNQITYDASEVVTEVTSIYESVEAALEDIKTNAFKLSDLLKPDEFFSYEELQKKMKWVFFDETPTVVTQAISTTVADTEAPAIPEVGDASQVASVSKTEDTEVAQGKGTLVDSLEATPEAKVEETSGVPKDEKLDTLLAGLM